MKYYTRLLNIIERWHLKRKIEKCNNNASNLHKELEELYNHIVTTKERAKERELRAIDSKYNQFMGAFEYFVGYVIN